MKTSIEIPFNVGDRAWALIDKSPVEVDIVAYSIEENWKHGRSIEYKMTDVKGDKSLIYTLPYTDIYPSKESVKMKLLDLENIRHSEELTRINSY